LEEEEALDMNSYQIWFVYHVYCGCTSKERSNCHDIASHITHLRFDFKNNSIAFKEMALMGGEQCI
jgi:hypothetical protein